MEVKIGVQHAQRELVIETDTTADEVEAHLKEALSSDTAFRVVDVKGRAVVVPAAKIAYVELGAASSGTVGFR